MFANTLPNNAKLFARSLTVRLFLTDTYSPSSSVLGKGQYPTGMCDVGVTDDVTYLVIVKMFDNLAYLVLRRTTAAPNGNKSIEQPGWYLGHLKVSS